MVEIILLLASFLVVIILIWLKVNIGVSIFLGALTLAFLSGLGINGALHSLYSTITSWSTLRLILIISFIMGITSVFSQIGYLKDMENAVLHLFPKAKHSLWTLPALIGLMPMPAGALVSAPMIEPVANKFNLKPEVKTLINYWFRHVWELSWPMYQAIVITSAVVGISIREISVKMFPLTILMATIGYLFFVYSLKEDKANGRNKVTGLKMLLKATYPILVIIVLSIILGLDMLYGSLVGFLSILLPNLKRISLKEVLTRAFQPRIVFLLIAVMYFKDVIEASGLVDVLPRIMLSFHVPIIIILLVTPFIIGLMTGISFAYVAMVFPLLKPFFTGFDKIALAYLGGYMGMLFSPVHLCLVFSAEYYKADLGKVYLRMLLPSLTFLVAGLLYIWLIL
ncbi:TIGR00529 family membrane protein [Pyrococcus abyssi]|uniref:DUF401 family protein n=1 Tax=Pyrococcus abyssi (strain GE5 / Orsay) TaxID=272844 RepID=Q9V2R1_PYRAB|nr:TIGR00529 family membrane protein [Pyrococcus abyssi]CAB48937.1 Hypothetical protein PAB2344 [Pyrococcus abyssi GE5]CCE69382.1 TPA: hypothetical protein PAB2344 [Pyrococcus abyssi GE5]